ncbi:MAG: winged helix-turn-helix transcriptional regulator [Candidatus Bathyarchaeota archaeon]|nr:MAG: winged helix-turn-helix transcriptional regulator [Candidatus Bathyarchaeota archaeon]
MVLEQKTKTSKRLERLVKSGICPAEDVSKYASELRQLVHETIDEDSVKMQSRLFKALADKTRLKIILLLDIREMCVCEIMVALGLTQPTASHHLGILESVDIVKDRREGKWVFYSLKTKSTMKLLKTLI